MNVLAHLHLATLANSSIIGNVAADFIKGDPYQQFSQDIADGIMMHRRVDRLTDQLAEVKQAKALFRQQTSRVAPIALDIIWDHFLSKHWQNYVVNTDVAEFDQQMKTIILPDISLFPSPFFDFMSALWRGQWLVNYADRDFISQVLNGMANRRPKLQTLRDTFIDFQRNYHQLERIFLSFYPQLMLSARTQQFCL
ncbi:ACP phosphodiesterase [Orbus sasakiae]|uniref:ACP phosphodiesterase n=1 Tax=Orbus sasakiae TaxID=1078475 RepID=A0ABP9N5K2_9GAMM